MIAGEDRTAWEQSVMLRRVLYPLPAFPPVNLIDYETGAFLTDILLAGAAF